jgi:hypothetical protein
MIYRLVQKVLVSPRFENFLISGLNFLTAELSFNYFEYSNLGRDPALLVPLEALNFSKHLSD